MTIQKTLSGGEVFLQGTYLSVGISLDGSIGTAGAAPGGYNTNVAEGYLRLGLMADFDGVGTGKASTVNDAVLRGTAVEGFNIGYKVDNATFIHSNQTRDGLREIAGKNSIGADAKKGEIFWNGETKENLDVSQKITLSDDAKYLRFDITLTNDSAKTMSDVHYMRTMDPDQGSTFVTNNQILKQGSGEALVAAFAGASSPVFFYANDARAAVSTYGFINEDPYASVAYSSKQAVGYTLKGDNAINIDFTLGTLKSGESQTLTFYLGLTDNLDGTITAIKADDAKPTTPVPTPTNIAPVAADDLLAVIGTQTGNGNVLANDKDANGDALTATLKSGPANGTVKLAADGSYTYVANKGFIGTDSFTYTASDGKASSSATVAIVVAAPPNAVPVAKGDSLSIVNSQTGTGNVLANDTDANGDALTATLKTGPKNGTVKLAADGSYTYVANKGFVGSDSFTYTASDGTASSSATVAIKVTGALNAAPVANADAYSMMNTETGTGNVLSNDADLDRDALVATLATGPAHGTLKLAADGSFTYVADKDFIGLDSFTYTASDGKTSSSAKVSIEVTAPPPAPTDPSLPKSVLLQRTGTVDGSASSNDKLVGAAHHNSFYFDMEAQTGADTILNFGKDDILVTKGRLYDSDGDGTVKYQKSTLVIDSPTGYKDTIYTPGTGSLRYLGTDADGFSAYANTSVRPKSTVESMIGNDVLRGDTPDKSKNVFFFDTALDLDLGQDKIVNFGAKDILVTTTAIYDGNKDGKIALGAGGKLDLVGGTGALDDTMTPGEAGSVEIGGIGGAVVSGLEFDGSVVRNGVTYFVYSLENSTAGTASLIF